MRQSPTLAHGVAPFRLAMTLSFCCSSVQALTRVLPHSFGRLQLPIYGAEHLLVFTRQDKDEESRLPILCSYDQGSRLEAELTTPGGAKANALALAADVLQRKAFFEGAVGEQIPMWRLGGLPGKLGAETLQEAMLAHLASCGLSPVQCQLGGVSSVVSVGMRDMGANTPAAPSSVRPDDLPAALICRRLGSAGGAGGVDGTSAATSALQLESAAEAVLLAREAELNGLLLPLLVSEALWEQRAVAPSRLPEFQDTLWSSTEDESSSTAA